MTIGQEFAGSAAAKAPPFSTLKEGKEMLFQAVLRDDTAEIEELVKQGVPVDGLRGIRFISVTPLILAVDIGALASVKKLLSLGADPDFVGGEERLSARGYAQLRSQYPEILPLMPPEKPQDGMNHVRHQAKFTTDEKGTEAAAVTVGSIQLTAINPLDHLYKSETLWNAARRGLADTLALFVAQGIKNIRIDNDGHALLYHAAASGNAKAVKVLLDAGFDPNKQDRAHITPLRAAMEGGHLSVVQLLLAHDADPYADSKGKNSVFKTDLEYATQDADIAISVAVKMAAKKFEINDAVINSDYERAEELLKGGAAPDVYDHLGMTALMQAAFLQKPKMVKLLLKYKADPNRTRKNGPGVALHSAVGRGNEEITDDLLAAGAKTWLRDRYGKDSLELAEKSGNTKVLGKIRHQRSKEISEAVTGRTKSTVAPERAQFRKKGAAP